MSADGIIICSNFASEYYYSNGKIIDKIPFHTHNYNKQHNLLLNANPHLESQIASISDDVAYNNHDVEDALRAKLITIESLNEIKYFNEIIVDLKKKFKDIEESRLTYQMLRISISKMVNDIIQTSMKNVKKNNINSLDDIKNHNSFLIIMSKKMKNECKSIKEFLFSNVYNHPKLQEKRIKVEKMTSKLFNYYLKNFDKLPEDWIVQEKKEDKNRIICDYISGMTDRFAIQLYKSSK